MTTRAPSPLPSATLRRLLPAWVVLFSFLLLTGCIHHSSPLGINLEVCPAWTIIVLDENGQPVPGLTVEQSWEYSGVAERQPRDKTVTDAQGRAAFPERVLSVNPALLAAAGVANALNPSIHNRAWGPDATSRVRPPSGYKNIVSVTWFHGGAIPENSRIKTEKEGAGYTTTFTLQRLDIFDAILKEDFVGAKQFLASDPSSAKMQSDVGFTPLFELARSDMPEAVELAGLLIAAGADVNARTKNGGTPLSAATNCANVEMMRLLLSKGAELGPTPNDPAKFQTPLHTVAGSSNASSDRKIKAIDLLLAHGANVNTKDRDGNTPLHLAAEHTTRPEVVKTLLERGADPTAHNTKGETPLDFTKHYNATVGTAATRELLTHPPPVKSAKPAAETPPAATPPATVAPAK